MNTEKVFLAVLVALLAFVAWLMVAPFLGYILFGMIMAFILHPLQKRMAPRIGPRVSAFLLMLLATAVIVLPLALATGAVIQDAQDFSQDVNQTELVNASEIEGLVEKYAGREVDVEKSVNKVISRFTNATFGSFSQFVSLFTNLAIGMTLMLFLLYYFLKDGPEMIEWVKYKVPLEDDVKEDLAGGINNTTWAVIKGHVLVAVAQGLIAGLGLLVVGVPNYVFWTFMMVLLGFIPLVGSFLVWGPASIYLFATSRPLAGTFLLFYGVVIVGLTDNILRPIVVDRSAELHPAVIIVGVIGGVYTFGAPGLFFGPILLGVFKAVLRVTDRNY